MVLRKGNVVRAVYGHGGHWWLKWDEAGRCYNCVSAAALDLDKFLDPRKEVENWDRCALYDLTFDD